MQNRTNRNILPRRRQGTKKKTLSNWARTAHNLSPADCADSVDFKIATKALRHEEKNFVTSCLSGKRKGILLIVGRNPVDFIIPALWITTSVAVACAEKEIAIR